MSAGLLADEKLWGHTALARWSFEPHSGGAERQFEYFVRAFSRMSVRVTVYCNAYRGNSERLGSNVNVKNFLCDHASFVEKINKEAQTDSPDFLHASEMLPGATSIRIGDGIHATFLKNMQKYNHGLNRLRFHPWLHRRKLEWEKKALAHTSLTHIISPSEMCLDDLQENTQGLAFRTCVIPNVIQPHLIDTPLGGENTSSTLRIIFVGSGYRRKGLELLLRSLARVNRPFTLQVVGQDSHQFRYQSLSRELGIEQNISWLGLVKDTTQIYRDADLLALPALYEPSGNVVLEALAMGVKVLISEFVGCKSFVNSDTGSIVSLNETEVVAAINQSSPAYNRQLIRDSVAHFTEAYFQNNLIRFYSGIV